MDTELNPGHARIPNSSDLERDAAVYAALGDPARLAIVRLLRNGDLSPRDIGRRLDLPSNLLAHHLGLLAGVGLIRRTRSEADARRVYVRLVPEAYPSVQGGPVAGPASGAGDAARVVFVCTHNSARSQLASALWRHRGRGRATSGGTHPADRIHPGAVAVAKRNGLALPRVRPRSIEGVIAQGDLVISVCDSADEELSATGTAHVHWSIPDPVRRADDAAFEAAFREIAERVENLAATEQTVTP